MFSSDKPDFIFLRGAAHFHAWGTISDAERAVGERQWFLPF
jgi:hypothetical protein